MTWGEGTGGSVVDEVDGDGVTWRYHKFLSIGSSTFTVTTAGDFEYLVVAGGGGGARVSGGGGTGGGAGGAGGVRFGLSTETLGSKTIVTGAGGAGGLTSLSGANGLGGAGGNSSALGVTCVGGGGGRGGGSTVIAGSGGSGGGGGKGPGGLGTAGQGFDGGDGDNPATNDLISSGGGGGAGGFGGNGRTNNVLRRGGDGGPGIEWPQASGIYYGGGGGGGSPFGVTEPSLGGVGGGGNGNVRGVQASTPGEANTGGGGGGGSGGPDSAGGSGVVVIRYVIAGTPPPPPDPSEVIVARGGEVFDEPDEEFLWRYHRFTRDGRAIFFVDEAPPDSTVEYLVVAGGGGGGRTRLGGGGDGGGGGGGGGVIFGSTSVSAGIYPLSIGYGGNSTGTGALDADAVGSQGKPSSSFSQSATGGGGGRGGSSTNNGGNGGSGGGAGSIGGLGGTGTAGQGFDGGDGTGGTTSLGQARGAGGGGAGAAGGNTDVRGGDGGNGIEWPIGSGNYYGGGGAGRGDAANIAADEHSFPGLGGGGISSAVSAPTFEQQCGQPNTGGGAGASGGTAGGDGVIIVRYIIGEVGPQLATVVTGDATEITKTSVKVSGTLVDDGGSPASRGFALATAPTFEATFAAISVGFGLGEYDFTFTGLSASTTYFFRATAVNSEGLAFGDFVSFTTDAGSPPTAVTGFASAIDFFGATLSGQVTDEGEGTVTDRGILVGPLPEPVAGQSGVVELSSGDGLGSFSATIAGLDPGTLHYFRAYGTNVEAGIGFGDDLTFTTLQAAGPTGLALTMPDADEDTSSTGIATFQTDPMDTLVYTWEVSGETAPPYTSGTTATVTVDGITAGQVEVTEQGDRATVVFTPAPDWFGTATFSYRVSNGFAFSDFAEATVVIRPVPDAPSEVVGEFPDFDENTTAEFDLTWDTVDDLPAGTLAATDGFFVQMRPTAGGPFRWLTEGSPTARLTNVIVRVLNYSNSELRGTFRVEPDAAYNGPYGAQVRVAYQLTEEQGGGYLFGPVRNLAGTIVSVPDAPTRPQPNRMPTARIGQTVSGRFTTFDPDIEDTSFTFQIALVGGEGAGVEATGGDTVEDVTVEGVNYRVHTFTTPGAATLDVTAGGDVEYLVVAGGGGGGFSPLRGDGGGGGGGGVLAGTLTVAAGTYNTEVSSGGAGRTGSGGTGANGGNATFGALVALGGGGGGASLEAPTSGGSGGGQGSGEGVTGPGPVGAGEPGQGNDGGAAFRTGNLNHAAGGGGGATQPGQDGNAATSTGGAGGEGFTSSITGTPTTYGSGGGGGAHRGTGGLGGTNAGNGGSVNQTGGAGVSNRGAGGGGGAGTGTGGSGSSGIIIVRYPLATGDAFGSTVDIPNVGTLTVIDTDLTDQKTEVRLVQQDGGATDLTYQFDLRVTDSSGLVSDVQTVTGFITAPRATVFLQKVTRNSPAVITPLAPLVEVFDLNVVDSIDGVGGANVTVSTDEIRRRADQLGITPIELLEPGTVELVVAIGTQIIFTGPLGEVEWSATDDRMSITARGLLAYFEERRIGTGTTSFVSQDISSIMVDLISDAQGQPFGDYAITDNSTTAGTNLTVEFGSRDRVLESIRRLSSSAGAPEVWIDPDRTFNTATARGQDRRNLIRLTPGMLESATWTNRDEQIATVVTVIGGEDGIGGFFQGTAVTTDTASLSKYGRREKLIERPALTSDQQCEDYAARAVEEQARRSEVIRTDVIVTPTRPFSIRDLEVGDIVTVDLRAPDLGQVIGAYRVVNRRLNLVSETADSYRVRLDLVPASFVNDALVRVKARHNASIVERLAQLDNQQE